MTDIFEILETFLSKDQEFLTGYEQSEISIDNFVASILRFVIKLFNPKKIIELGTLYGRSAILMSRFSSYEANIYSIEKNKEHYEIALKNIIKNKLESKIKLFLGDCQEILNQDFMKNLQADMMFIDANKLKYSDYLDWAVEFLSKNGVMIIDNIFIHKVLEKYQDESCRMYQEMEKFLEKIKNKSLFNSLIIPYSRDGLAIVVKK